MTLRAVTRPLDDDRPLLELAPDGPALCWVHHGEGFVAWGEAVRVNPGPGPDRMGRADEAWSTLVAGAEVDDPIGLPGTGLVAFGSFTFHDDVAGSVLLVPRVVVGRRGGITWLTRIGRAGDGHAPGPRADRPRPVARDRPRFAGSSQPDLHWLEAVAEAIKRIRAGEAEKVVLARDHAVWSREPFDAQDLARRLAAVFPRCHTFVLDGLVGATPELLVARQGRRVVSRVLAGTTGRSDDEVEDAALGAGLLGSAKDRHEHDLAARSVREVLGPRCTTLTAAEEPRLLRLDNVQHLATVFEGELIPGPAIPSALALAGALHPTAAVGGTPTAVALTMIRQLEQMDRGRYAAPVGWVDANGDGEFGIALRCAELAGARARLFAGVGIVDGSLPEDELEETRLKLRAMQSVLEA